MSEPAITWTQTSTSFSGSAIVDGTAFHFTYGTVDFRNWWWSAWPFGLGDRHMLRGWESSENLARASCSDAARELHAKLAKTQRRAG